MGSFLPMKTKLSSFALANTRIRGFLLVISLIALTGTSITKAASVSELLEQGVYSEETKGDIEEAIQYYQQIISQAKTDASLAAQAQYRLGVCYYKQHEYAAATEAFEKLVADYPDQKQLVAKANTYLAGAAILLPAPWTSGEQLRLDIVTQTGFKLGYANYTAVSDQANGKQIWRLGTQLTASGSQQASRVEVDAESMKPWHSRWRHSLLGEAQVNYSGDKAEVRLLGSDTVQTLEVGGACYDNEEVMQLMRRLPLTTNYSATLRVVTGLGGSVIQFKTEVTGVETLEVPAGTFECYKLRLNLVNQTFWISTDAHRYVVQFEAGPIKAKLAAIEKVDAAEWIRQPDAEFNFPLGNASTTPTVESQEAQSAQNQAKLLVLMATMLRTLPDSSNWCDALNGGGSRLPAIPTNTVFAFNGQLSRKLLTDLPNDTVVFFETASPGWNRSGGPELIAQKPTGTAVAFADGRALLVSPSEIKNLRWSSK